MSVGKAAGVFEGGEGDWQAPSIGTHSGHLISDGHAPLVPRSTTAKGYSNSPRYITACSWAWSSFWCCAVFFVLSKVIERTRKQDRKREESLAEL
jgi:hypothetical protein